MKHFLDIEVARFEDTEFKTNNVAAFVPGDLIQITEKVDGSNASVTWDAENNRLAAFSRKQELTYSNTLNGFYNYVQKLNEDANVVKMFADNPNLVVFGEWNLTCNKIKDYEEQYRKIWIVYDIYDKNTTMYCKQDFVKEFAEKAGFTYIHALYEGPFISWDHVRTFLHANTYGETQEGVVIKNQDKLIDAENRMPTYLKIVNESFKESMKPRVKKEKSADELAEEKRVQDIVDSLVTVRRVEKSIERLRDSGVLPAQLTPKDMSLVAKNVPKDVYDDLLKEEKEYVISAGEKFGKMCGSAVMKIARNLIAS